MSYSVLSRYRSELMGIAMLWVMLFHATDLIFPAGLLNSLRSAGFGGVDIFITVSAMGLVMSLNGRKQTYGEFMVRRLKRIYPAYLAAAVPYTLILWSQGQAFLSSLFWNLLLLNYWIRCPGSFNWYVSGIVLLYAVTVPCFLFLRSREHRIAWTAGGAAAGLLLCQLLMQDGYWQYMDIMYRIPVFFTGLLMGFFVLEERKLRLPDMVFWLTCAAAGIVYAFYACSHDMFAGLYTPLCHAFLLTTIPMCLVACFLFEKLPLGAVRRLLRLIGSSSLEIYLLNVTVFCQTGLLRPFFQFSFDRGGMLHWLILFTLNILLGLLFHHLVQAAMNALARLHGPANSRQ